ncbi:MAG TPA: hypothetical protein VG226_01610 [Acidimicrobiales bacterium]|nr:hypothetical protein [Acidimicrobiales bacterium]
MLYRTAAPRGESVAHLSTNTVGTVLLAGSADGGGKAALTEVEVATGQVKATLPFPGQNNVEPAGPLDGTIWVAYEGGMSGILARLSAGSLAPTGPPCPEGGGNLPSCTTGDNGITVTSAAGAIWATQYDGYNRCFSPTGEQVLANLPVTASEDVVGIGDAHYFVADGSGYLTAAPVPSACRLT